MVSLPGWDSLESVNRWVTFYEFAMIIILVTLVGAEVLYFKYSHRKDALIEVRERRQTVDTRRQRDDAEARKAEVEQLQNRLAEAHRKVAELEGQAPRRLTDDQRRALIRALSPFRNQKIVIESAVNDAESVQFGSDFVNVFEAAGWSADNVGTVRVMYAGSAPIGVDVLVNPETDIAHIPAAVAALVSTLFELGLMKERNIRTDTTVAIGAIRLRTGRKADALRP
jgi:hypothetical protein